MNALPCRIHIRPVGKPPEPAALAAAVAKKKLPVILGANASVEGRSVFAAEPVEVLNIGDGDANPLEKLQTALGKYRLREDAGKSFCPGWMGYLSYDLGRHIEKIPAIAADDIKIPLAHLAFYDSAIVCDHRSGQWSVAALEFENGGNIEKKFRRMQTLLDQSGPIAPPPVRPAKNNNAFKSNITADYYFDAVGRIKRHILDGDVYQVNLSQRFECEFAGDPAELFLWQSTHNPGPYAAFVATPDFAVVSASPELFMQISGDDILTRPIKGTRPRRNNDEEFNRRQYDELLSSEKEAAELAMIVDLERNDIARICIPGSRMILRRRVIEPYTNVYHAFGEVAGKLAGEKGPQRICDILRATFPGGSITGAPKIAAMSIIERLEPARRGVYTGAIGWIGANFDMCLNIAIRTIVVKNGRAYAQTGGGIVADSNPKAEWNETLVKAKALLEGINACA